MIIRDPQGNPGDSNIALAWDFDVSVLFSGMTTVIKQKCKISENSKTIERYTEHFIYNF